MLGILKFLKKEKFGKNSKQAIKNSSYQFAQTLIAKIGSLVLIIILARRLMPELFGLYSLALFTIVLFASFSDLGISSALITFISKKSSKGKIRKAKAYFNLLKKWKIYLLGASSLILMSSSYFVAFDYYNKPIFLALLAGGLYIPLIGFSGFLESFFKSFNNFRIPLFKEGIFQILRLVFVSLVVLFLIKEVSESILIFIIILTLGFAYFGALLFLFFESKRGNFLAEIKEEPLDKNERKELKKFILPLSATALSGLFFGYIDIIMLGHFVLGKFLGYYSVAISLVGSASALLGFAGASMLPIFSGLRKDSLERSFSKIRNFIIILSVLAFAFTFFLAPYIIEIIYGPAYSSSIILLRIFSVLIIVLSLSSLYNAYFISQERTLILAKFLVGTTFLNIILNYFFITYGLQFGMGYALIGAAIATVISRIVYFFGIVWFRRR